MCVTRILGLHRRLGLSFSVADGSRSSSVSKNLRGSGTRGAPRPLDSPGVCLLRCLRPYHSSKRALKWLEKLGNEAGRACSSGSSGFSALKGVGNAVKPQAQIGLGVASTSGWKQCIHVFHGMVRSRGTTLSTAACSSKGAILSRGAVPYGGMRPLKDVSRSIVSHSRHGFHTSSVNVRYDGGFARRIKGLVSWKNVWRKVKARIPSRTSIGLVVRAVSLACARSHLPIGIATLLLGGSVNHPLAAEAQGGGSASSAATPLSSSSSSNSLFSSLFAMLELGNLILRLVFLILLFTPVVVTAPMADAFNQRYRKVWLRLVRYTLELAGAAFIKWGQWAATRPDLFPRDLCRELTKLHTNAPAHKFAYSVKTVEQAFGKKLNEIFEYFEEKPVASGSIAQVHKATLKYSGSLRGKPRPIEVAVKVRHPGVSDVIRRDFVIMNWIANLSTLTPGLSWLRLDESVRQFAVFMLTQVDLAREAAHLSRFLYNFRNWRDVSFPRPLYPLVHPAVLVETYEQGDSVSQFIELSEKGSNNSRMLAHLGTHTFLKMLLVDNFIHADMHPGNILVRLQSKRKGNRSGTETSRSRPHLVFLDVGLTAELSQKDRRNLLEFFKAVALRDGKTAAECALSFTSNQSCPNPGAFIKELETSFTFWGSREADPIHPGECMQDLLEQVRKHRVNIDGDVCTVMVTIMVLEGWQRRLDPDYNIMDTLQKLLFKKDWSESLSYTINGVMAP